jgi:transcriptional regulator GlxA family with amidase domain
VNRRRFIAASALAVTAGAPVAALALRNGGTTEAAAAAPPLPVPEGGTIRTAVAIGHGVNVIDMSGPWEVFQDTGFDGGLARFELYAVSGTTDPVVASGGLTVTPTYAYGDAPDPHVVVVPAHNATPETVEWLRHASRSADLIMSVCTGAFVLAETGLLDGKTATTHHQSYDAFAAQFPKITVVRGLRYVEHEHVATAGGLTSGIDLALRVVERYLGDGGAAQTARYMEYRQPRT